MCECVFTSRATDRSGQKAGAIMRPSIHGPARPATPFRRQRPLAAAAVQSGSSREQRHPIPFILHAFTHNKRTGTPPSLAEPPRADAIVSSFPPPQAPPPARSCWMPRSVVVVGWGLQGGRLIELFRAACWDARVHLLIAGAGASVTERPTIMHTHGSRSAMAQGRGR